MYLLWFAEFTGVVSQICKDVTMCGHF